MPMSDISVIVKERADGSAYFMFTGTLPYDQAKQLAEIVAGFHSRPFVLTPDGPSMPHTITGIRYEAPQE